MTSKLKALFTSVRFYQVTGVAVLQVFAYYFIEFKGLADILSAYLGIVVTIGSIDSVATKFRKVE